MKEKYIKEAIKSFGGKGKFKDVFNLAGYQRIIQKEFNLDNPLSSKIARNHLNNDNILKLSGECHYLYKIGV